MMTIRRSVMKEALAFLEKAHVLLLEATGGVSGPMSHSVNLMIHALNKDLERDVLQSFMEVVNDTD